MMHKMSRETEFCVDKTCWLQLFHFGHCILDVKKLYFQKQCYWTVLWLKWHFPHLVGCKSVVRLIASEDRWDNWANHNIAPPQACVPRHQERSSADLENPQTQSKGLPLYKQAYRALFAYQVGVGVDVLTNVFFFFKHSCNYTYFMFSEWFSLLK